MKITLVRHTTLDIAEGICYGQADVLPSATFDTESKTAKKNLSNYTFDNVYSSPLKRCTKLAEACGFENLKIENRIIEIDFGNWELIPWNDIHGEYAQKWMDDYLNFPAPNGESLQDMIKRIEDFLFDLRQSNYNHVLCFTHSGPIRVFEHLINQIPIDKLFDFEVEYAGLYHYSL